MGRQYEDRITADGVTRQPPGEVSQAHAPWGQGETRGGVPRSPRRPLAQPSSEDLGEVSGISMTGRIRAFLESQGVDVDRAVEDAGHAKERQRQRAQNRVRVAGDLAYQLRRARRALVFEQNGWRQGAPGFNLARVTEARQKVTELDEALRSACLDDPEIRAEVLRRAAR